MKKLMVSALTAALSAALLVGVMGCAKKESSATVYDLVSHGTSNYFVVVDITADKKGDVKKIKIDEVMLAEWWAKQAKEGENSSFSDTILADDNTAYAKYVQIGDKKLQATGVTGSGSNAKLTYAALDDSFADLTAELKTDKALQKVYYDAAKAGIFKILKKTGDDAYEVEKDGKNNDYGSLFKSTSTYWQGETYPLGWKGNIKAMEDYVKEYGVKYTSADLNDIEPVDGKFYLTDVNTGATIGGFAGYMTVVKAAFDQAMQSF